MNSLRIEFFMDFFLNTFDVNMPTLELSRSFPSYRAAGSSNTETFQKRGFVRPRTLQSFLPARINAVGDEAPTPFVLQRVGYERRPGFQTVTVFDARHASDAYQRVERIQNEDGTIEFTTDDSMKVELIGTNQGLFESKQNDATFYFQTPSFHIYSQDMSTTAPLIYVDLESNVTVQRREGDSLSPFMDSEDFREMQRLGFHIVIETTDPNDKHFPVYKPSLSQFSRDQTKGPLGKGIFKRNSIR